MEKEFLRKRYIIQDLKNHYYQSFLVLLITVPLMIASTLLVTSFSSMASMPWNAKIIILIIPVLLSICAIAEAVIGLIKVSTGHFTVVSDKVVKKFHKKIGTTIFTPFRPHMLIFSKYGEYGIQGKNYTWSARFKETDDCIYKTTTIGEEFYIVRVGKRNVLAYSKNLFTTEENNTSL